MRPRGLAASWPHGIRGTLNKSPSAGQRIFFTIRAVPKAGNTQSIPPLSEPSPREKYLAASSRGFRVYLKTGNMTNGEGFFA